MGRPPPNERDKLYAMVLEALAAVENAMDEVRRDCSNENMRALNEAMILYSKLSAEYRDRLRR